MKNRSICKLLAATTVVTLLLVGCGSSNAATGKQETASETTEVSPKEENVTEEVMEGSSMIETISETESPDKEAVESETKTESATEPDPTVGTKEATTEDSPLYVKTYAGKYFILDNGEEQLSYETIYEYDDHANVILKKVNNLHPDNGVSLVEDEVSYEYEYNEKGIITKTIIRTYTHFYLDGEKQLMKETTREHDEEGKIIHEETVSFPYDEGKGSSNSDSQEEVTKQDYSYNGNQYTSTVTDADGSILVTEEGFVIDGTCYPTKRVNAKGEVGEIIQYDEYHNIISDEYTLSNFCFSMEIEYDEHHNPITESTLNSEGKITSYEKRTYELFK